MSLRPHVATSLEWWARSNYAKVLCQVPEFEFTLKLGWRGYPLVNQHSCRKSPSLIGKSTIKVPFSSIFNSYVANYQRVYWYDSWWIQNSISPSQPVKAWPRVVRITPAFILYIHIQSLYYVYMICLPDPGGKEEVTLFICSLGFGSSYWSLIYQL